MRTLAVSLFWMTFLLPLPVRSAEGDGDPEGMEFFERRIRPVLVERCYSCHSSEAGEAKGGLLLDTREAIRKGGESGSAVVPHQPQESLLLEAVRYESFEMPPDGRLQDEVIADLEKWISRGAPDPRDAPAVTIEPHEKVEIDWESARQFWAFQRPERHVPPQVRDEAGAQRPIDQFLLARLDEAGLEPNGPADARTLLRRMFLDVIGLPPSPEQAERFLTAAAVDRSRAVADLVEELLASPHFGERWAVLWLDVARYAEDQAHIVGSNKELFYPNAWRFRDWVIDAFNRDLPYDEFLRRQLAADLISADEEADLPALGFIGLGPKYYRRNSPEVMADEWEDRVDTVTRGLLGLTVACARCHDHKYDPISAEDYYALAGVFASTEMFNRPLEKSIETAKNGHAKEPDQSLHVVRESDPQNVHLLIRGDINRKGPEIPRRFLQILSDCEPVPLTDGSGRRKLAECITDQENPLTARVIVNRIWGAYFGRGLVGTASNFGRLGERPSHPKLLDDLAVRFMEQGWSLKWLHREILLSAAYQRSSDIVEENQLRDPDNRLLWRMNRRRLSVEQWRDSVLSAAGNLDSAVGGKSITPDDADERRRTVYSERSRFQLNEMLALFDAPDPNAHSEGRIETTTPLQKLFVLNSPFIERQASSLAERLRTFSDKPHEQVRHAYAILFAREPTEEESRLAAEYLSEADLTLLAQVLLASNEMLVLD
jgi:mono/diheme cytochrome c family protein